MDHLISHNAPSNKSRYPFIKLPYPIKEANALSRTTIALYEAILWFQRNKADCFPGYEKLKRRAKIKSKTTLSLHMKVLIKVGLIKRQRRGKMQSNIYQAMELSPQIVSNLRRSHAFILKEIAENDEKARKMRLVKRELKAKRPASTPQIKIAQRQTYPQTSEVQLLNTKKAFQAFSTYSSNLNNDSKEKIREVRQGRGGEFKSISEYLRPTIKSIVKNAQGPLSKATSPGDDERPTPNISPIFCPLQPHGAHSKITQIILKISGDIRDLKHQQENVSQAINIFKQVESRGVDENNFVEALWSARGLTMEIMNYLDRPGAYFFKILRDRCQIQLNSS